jgi:hypothetical protein
MEFRSKVLFGRSVEIDVIDAILSMISSSVTTMEKDVRGPLWPFWPRRSIPITLIGVWFEREDGTEFDIVLRNAVPPGQPGTQVTILNSIDKDGNQFLYSIYNHAAGQWRRLNSFQGLWFTNLHRPPVKWERWMMIVSVMPMSGAVWIGLLSEVDKRWLYATFLTGFLMGVILLATKAVECARLWRFLGRAESAVELASGGQAYILATNRSETLNEKNR